MHAAPRPETRKETFPYLAENGDEQRWGRRNIRKVQERTRKKSLPQAYFDMLYLSRRDVYPAPWFIPGVPAMRDEQAPQGGMQCLQRSVTRIPGNFLVTHQATRWAGMAGGSEGNKHPAVVSMIPGRA